MRSKKLFCTKHDDRRVGDSIGDTSNGHARRHHGNKRGRNASG